MVDLQEIQSTGNYQKMMDDSTENLVLLFKHSTTCPIGSAAYEQYQTLLKNVDNNGISAYLIKVMESREISTQVEDRRFMNNACYFSRSLIVYRL